MGKWVMYIMVIYRPAALIRRRGRSDQEVLNMKSHILGALLLLIAVSSSGCAAGVVMDERSVGTQLSDAEIVTSVKSSLLGDDMSKGLDVHVYSFKAHVYLVGEVDNAYRKHTVTIAEKTEGVRQVTAHWFPVGTSDGGNDLAIETRVAKALLFAKDVRSTQVEVEVWGGNVVLLGLMESRADIDRAVSATKGVSGVKSVTSYLTVMR